MPLSQPWEQMQFNMIAPSIRVALQTVRPYKLENNNQAPNRLSQQKFQKPVKTKQ